MTSIDEEKNEGSTQENQLETQGTGFEQDSSDYQPDVYKKPAQPKNRKKQASLSALQRSIIKTVACVLILLIVVGAGCLIFPTKIFAKSTAMKVGDVKIPMYEYNFNYWTEVQYFIDTYGSYLGENTPDVTKALDKQVCYLDTSITWQEYFKNYTSSYLSTVAVMWEKAVALDLQLSEGNKREIDFFIADTLQGSADYNEVSLDTFIKVMYGKTLNIDRVRASLERIYLAQVYNDYMLSTFDVSDDKLNSWLETYKDEFFGVKYRAFSFKPASDEAEDIVETKNLAREFMAKFTDELSFAELAYEYAPEAEKENYAGVSRTLYDYWTVGKIGDTAISDWLFDDDRKAEDKTVIYSESSGLVYVLYYLDNGYSDLKSVNLYSLFVGSETTTNETMEDAKAYIENIQTEFEENGKTDEAFKALVTKYSEDTYSLSDYGFYENAIPDNMTDNIRIWCYSGRTAGDYGIVEGDNGYFLLYYGSEGIPVYKAQAISDIKDSMLMDWQDETFESISTKTYGIVDFMLGK